MKINTYSQIKELSRELDVAFNDPLLYEIEVNIEYKRIDDRLPKKFKAKEINYMGDWYEELVFEQQVGPWGDYICPSRPTLSRMPDIMALNFKSFWPEAKMEILEPAIDWWESEPWLDEEE